MNDMESIICDELMIEIFERIPPPRWALPLVSKRWLHLFRHSITSLSLVIPPKIEHDNMNAYVSYIITQYPFLSSLSISSSSSSSDSILMSVVCCCPSLKHLRLLATTPPVCPSSLLCISSFCNQLTCLAIPLSRPVSFSWVPRLPVLKELSLVICGQPPENWNWVCENNSNNNDQKDEELELESKSKLEVLSVCGLTWSDFGMGWLWRNSPMLKKLHLRSCQGVGDGGSYSSLSYCLKGLVEVELRSCRTICDMVLLKLAENSDRLDTLLVYDGGSKDGLLHFIMSNNSQWSLKKLDLRLPLDLNNDHLYAMGERLRSLKCLRLQNSCLVTGDGLRTFSQSQSLRDNLEELALINCDVVERVPGLLTTLGQNLKGLKRLDLSYNQALDDKELVSMLVSCDGIVELSLRGCEGLTNIAIGAVVRVCRILESVDVVQCGGIDHRGVEILVANLNRLKKIKVELYKVSDVATNWVSNRMIQVIGP